MIPTRENRNTRKITRPTATLSTTDLTRTGLGLNPDLQVDRPATNPRSHSMSSKHQTPLHYI
jgi:hypothetical protein